MEGIGPSAQTELEANKSVVRRLVDQVLNKGNLDLLDDLYTADQAALAREWIAAFRASFPDMNMVTVELVAEGDLVIGRFTCTATHLGTWMGHPPTGRVFNAIGEVNRYRIHEGRIAETWTLEDNLERLTQLGLLTSTDQEDD